VQQAVGGRSPEHPATLECSSLEPLPAAAQALGSCAPQLVCEHQTKLTALTAVVDAHSASAAGQKELLVAGFKASVSDLPCTCAAAFYANAPAIRASAICASLCSPAA
jgi:hypothetical protein